jgi:hypothetical protein
MAFGIPQVLGHHGNELQRFDELMGGKNRWRNLSPQLLDLLAVRYLITPVERGGGDALPGFQRVLDSVPTSAGVLARLYERTNVQPYARVVPAAVKTDDSLVVGTLVDPRLPGFDRVVFYDPDAPVRPEPVTAWPEPSAARGTVTQWEPGAMTVLLDPPPTERSYVLIAENWYPDWQASVDGTPTPVVRGNHTLITVPVPAGARRVELAFRSRHYRTGRAVSLASWVIVLVGFGAPIAFARRRRG